MVYSTVCILFSIYLFVICLWHYYKRECVEVLFYLWCLCNNVSVACAMGGSAFVLQLILRNHRSYFTFEWENSSVNYFTDSSVKCASWYSQIRCLRHLGGCICSATVSQAANLTFESKKTVGIHLKLFLILTWKVECPAGFTLMQLHTLARTWKID